MNDAKTRRGNRRTPTRPQQNWLDCHVESLENRCLLAGSVTVNYAGGTVTITGDGADNDIVVRQATRYGLTVDSGNDTTQINTIPHTRTQPISKIIVQLKAGNDRVEFVNLGENRPNGKPYIRQVQVDGSGGRLHVGTTNLSVGSLDIGNSGDVLSAVMRSTGVDGDVVISGADGTWVDIQMGLGIGRSIHGNIQVTSIEGSNHFQLDGVRVRNRDIKLDYGSGSSNVSIQNADRLRGINISAAGSETASHFFELSDFSGSETGRVSGGVKLNYRSGNSTTTVRDVDVDGEFRLDARDGYHNVRIQDAKIGKQLFLVADNPGKSLDVEIKDESELSSLRMYATGSKFLDIQDSKINQSVYASITRTPQTLGNHSTTVSVGSFSEIGGSFSVYGVGDADSSFTIHQFATVKGDVKFAVPTADTSVFLLNAIVEGSVSLGLNKAKFGGQFIAQYESIDDITIQNSDIRKNVSIHTNNGGGDTRIVDTVINGNFVYEGGYGHDDVRINDTEIGRNVTIKTSTKRPATQADNDYVSIERSGDNDASEISGKVTVLLGYGDDRVLIGGNLHSVNSVSIGGKVRLDGGDGTDLFDIGDYAYAGNGTSPLTNFTARNFES